VYLPTSTFEQIDQFSQNILRILSHWRARKKLTWFSEINNNSRIFAGWVNPCCHYSEHTEKYCNLDIFLKKIHGHSKQMFHGVFKNPSSMPITH